jgi:hypothetical protein
MTERLKNTLSKNAGIVILLLTLFGILLALLYTSGLSTPGVSTMPKKIFQDALFGDSSCHLPCWQEITPGVTTRSQALALLESNQLIYKGSIGQSDLGNNIGGCMWIWKEGEWTIHPGLSWNNDIVDEITIGIPVDMKVEEIISRFGTPEILSASNGGIPEHWYWNIVLYYPQSGMQFIATTSEYVSAFDPSTRIEGVKLYPPMSLDQRLSHEDPNNIRGELVNLFKPWKGYGDLQKFYGFQRY